MFVRKVTVKGVDYFQIIKGVREGDRVRQVLVAALGTTDDPREALKRLREKLKGVQWDRNRFPRDYKPRDAMTRRLLTHWDAQIKVLEERIAAINQALSSGELRLKPR
jgi:hypothetical protein